MAYNRRRWGSDGWTRCLMSPQQRTFSDIIRLCNVHSTLRSTQALCVSEIVCVRDVALYPAMVTATTAICLCELAAC